MTEEDIAYIRAGKTDDERARRERFVLGIAAHIARFPPRPRSTQSTPTPSAPTPLPELVLPLRPIPGRPAVAETLLGNDGLMHIEIPGHGHQPVVEQGLGLLNLTPTGQLCRAPHLLGRLAAPATNAVGIPLTGPAGPLIR